MKTKTESKKTTKTAAKAKNRKSTAATPADAPTRKEPRSMADTLKKHRGKYVHTDGYAGLSVNNGDDVATALRMFEPDRVIAIAEQVLPNIKKGDLAARYAKLNNGQKRMNAGNRIRAAVKNGTITLTALKRALKAA